MSSIRNNPSSAEDVYLDAARSAILAVGWSRTTLTEIARRAGVSRMTIYRRWPDMQALMGDLMTREWAALLKLDPSSSDQLERIVDSVVSTTVAIRDNELFHRIVELDPDVLLPYLLERSGRSQELVIALLTGEITKGQKAGKIRLGRPEVMARSVVLAAHGFALSSHTMGDPDTFDTELGRLIESYLRP